MNVLKTKVLEMENILLKDRIDNLERQLGIDQLTGASNRRVFERELEQALKIIRGDVEEHRANDKQPKGISLVFIDLDYFKRINDTLGHPTGDKVLQKVSALLMDSIRDTDTVARLGGEEFVILLRGADETIAARHAEKLRSEIERITFDSSPGLKITASFGVISSNNSTEAKTLYERGDKALYAAKQAGRNRVEVYNGEK